jgi:ATPase subunit of ABC transporter with duplicated ATPase domains
MPEATPAIVSASLLVVKYGPHTVLDGASLTIHEGERVGLVGRNGSGKSTFLQIAAGALEPDSGEFHPSARSGYRLHAAGLRPR